MSFDLPGSMQFSLLGRQKDKIVGVDDMGRGVLYDDGSHSHSVRPLPSILHQKKAPHVRYTMASPLAGVLSGKHSLAVLFLLLASYPACHAGKNVTAFLAGHPELGEFGSLLASTGLTLDIMGRIDPLTVLAVDNDGMAPLRNMPREAIRQHLSLHVLLGLYDPDMLGRLLPGESAELTTLFQRPSGDAPRGIGMVEVSGPDPDDRYPRVSFVHSGPGVGSGVWRLAFFVKSVYEEPNMVVLQVSATMSAPWLPGSPAARRDDAGGDAAGSGAKKT